MSYWGLVLLITTMAWARPEGILTGQPWAQKAQAEIDSGRFDEALVSLRVDLKTPLDRAWHGYLSGLAFVGLERFGDADSALLAAKQVLEAEGEDAGARRMLSKVERKLGLVHRKQKNYEKSREVHYLALDLAQLYGSAEEEHDCLISIDVDCWHIQDWEESERVLRQSLEIAAQITDPVARTRAQATSSNNLAGTLSEVGNFEEAVEQAQAALAAWSEWEKMTGDMREFRSGWAHYTLADVYLSWAKRIEDSLDASNKRGMAKYELILMMKLAQDAGRPQDEFDLISKRLAECE
ncbi:MAG: tetratricopeptide repeat protein [Calditrichaeota bacterium]|nr:tetratricopeptide repeat protein [Calditrichota bacterium]MCB9391420.1 tetratricopeptide repeat protein [Calditrichota bacterium]